MAQKFALVPRSLGLTPAEERAYALAGGRIQIGRILEHLPELRHEFGGPSRRTKAVSKGKPQPKAPKAAKKRRMSKEGRERIAAAARRRWVKFRAEKKKAAK